MEAKKTAKKFLLRLEADLFTKIQQESIRLGASINELIQNFARTYLEGQVVQPIIDHVTFEQIKHKISRDIFACVLFGSQSRGDRWEDSDVDLLFLCAADAKITRDWYRRWDAMSFEMKLSPLFIAIPRREAVTEGQIPSVLLEAAVDGKILHDNTGRTAHTFLLALRDRILEGQFRRTTLHGQPVWSKI